MRKTKLMLLAVIAGLLATAPAADAKKLNVRVGIGDQNASMFSHPDFQRLKIKRVRYFIPWHAISQPHEMQRATDFVNAAKAAGVSVLMHISSDNLVRKMAKLPSRRVYKQHVKPLVRHFRGMGVRE